MLFLQVLFVEHGFMCMCSAYRAPHEFYILLKNGNLRLVHYRVSSEAFSI